LSASRRGRDRFGADIANSELKKHSRSGTPNGEVQSVSAIDRQEYRKLQDKRDRIMLKKKLYEKKKIEDEEEVVVLAADLNQF